MKEWGWRGWVAVGGTIAFFISIGLYIIFVVWWGN